MARPKEFDQDQALQEAMEIFWAKGFEATSMQDLVDGMGINRQSLYDTFGHKEKLYHAALERYRGKAVEQMFALLEGDLPFRKALATLFNSVAAHLSSPASMPCFMAYAALERSRENPLTARYVRDSFERNIARFEGRIRRAREAGEIGPHHDPAALARYLQNALHGLQITARCGASPADLDAIVRTTLSVLG
jgi:TetR/AcrR family transcriptional repressor of nem operon